MKPTKNNYSETEKQLLTKLALSSHTMLYGVGFDRLSADFALYQDLWRVRGWFISTWVFLAVRIWGRSSYYLVNIPSKKED